MKKIRTNPPSERTTIKTITHDTQTTPYGNLFIATTEFGLCKINTLNDKTINQLQSTFPNATLKHAPLPKFTSLNRIGLQREMSRKSNCPRTGSVSVDTTTCEPEAQGNLICRPFIDEDQYDLDLYGTPFQLKVWQQLLKIPYAATTTYTAIAQQIGKPKATRAVGSAIGKNPLAILIPCHRVLRKDQKIGGYAWGVEMKEQLLKAEKVA